MQTIVDLRIMRMTAVAFLAFFATGCATTNDGSPSEAAPPPVTTAPDDAPEFSGPYAAEFADFYQNANSDFVREVLADEVITDAEYAEMKNRFSICLSDRGVTLKEIAPDGSISTSVATGGGNTNSIVSDCSKQSGESTIGALYTFTQANPDNIDTATAVAACLVRDGVVSPDYDAADFSIDIAGRFAAVEELSPELKESLMSCSSDPLGLVEAG